MNERSIEYSFVFKSISIASPKKALDVGTGLTALPALIKACDIDITAIDKDKSQIQGNLYWKVVCDDIMDSKLNSKFDLVTCISVLEHIKEYNMAIKSMVEKLNSNGFLILTFPYNETKYIANNYDLPNAGYGQGSGILCQSFSREQIDGWVKSHNLKIIEQEYWRVFTGDYWTVGSKLNSPSITTKDGLHQLTCVLLQRI